MMDGRLYRHKGVLVFTISKEFLELTRPVAYEKEVSLGFKKVVLEESAYSYACRYEKSWILSMREFNNGS